MPESGLPVLVMIPGTLCDGRIFARQVRALRGKARVVRVDYASLVHHADWQRQLLARLPARFSVAGFSLGGLLALELLRAAPERIERIALLASNAEPASAAGRRRSETFWRLWRNPRRGPRAVADRAKPAYFHAPRCRRENAALVRHMAQHTPAAAARAEFAWAGSRPESHQALKAFEGPLLIVSGSHDKLCPPAWQRGMAQSQPHAEWVEINRCGHFVPLEAPAALSRALAQWITRPAVAGRPVFQDR